MADGTLEGALGVYRGELAALATAFCWTLSALAFTAAARRLGSVVLNLIRLLMAFVLLSVYGWAARGLPLPSDATAHNWFWLSLSGFVGFALGDLCLFRSLVLLGPRLTTLLMALAPPIAAVVGWLWLGEGMSVRGVAGMAMTVAGVAWVVLERRVPTAGRAPGALGPPQSVSVAGVLLGLGGAVGQAVGLVLSKLGKAGYDAFAGTQIRIIAAAVGFAVLLTALRAWPRFLAALRHPGGMGYAALGSAFGPALGVALSLVAVEYARVGVAATLMAIVPVLIIPFVILVYREKVSLRAVAGAALAVAGIALLFLRS